MLRRVVPTVVVVGVAVALFLATRPGPAGRADPLPQASPTAAPASSGVELFLRDCAWCHGSQGLGTSRGPTLVGQGAAGAHFWLSTGRMPIPTPETNPRRKPSPYTPRQIRDLVDVVASFGPGPPIPTVVPAAGSLSEGATLYEDNCAACHGSTGAGGALTSGLEAPSLSESTPAQVAEAIRIGPGTMPVFGPEVLSDDDVNSIARYVDYLRHPQDRGGAPLGHLGPIPEGFVAWAIGLLGIVLVVRWIGEAR